MKLAVVIPALDEARSIDGCLERLRATPGIDEIVVVDGGSRDDTAARAHTHGVSVLHSERGRGRQLNRGARACDSEVLWFLHVDGRAPADGAASIRRALADPRVVGGAFRTWTVSHRTPPPRWAPLLHLADLRSRYSRVPYGDQGIFVRRAAFDAIGGFPEIALMEDLVFSRRLRRHGRTVTLRQSIRVSGRRFEAAPLRQTLLVNILPALYAAGVPPSLLARLYRNPR